MIVHQKLQPTLAVIVTAFVTLLPSPTLFAEPPQLQLITTGWNAPTIGQFARDISQMPGELPLTGAVLTLHADSGNPNPLAKAHDTSDWSSLDVQRSVKAMSKVRADQSSMPDSYLIFHTNPGNVDWLDDAGWEIIVQHYEKAAQVAQQCGLRGLLIDFEPYDQPFRQFQYSRQSQAKSQPFSRYTEVTRQRGREVMQAISKHLPEAEIYTYFALSYLVEDHPYRGPSPVGRSDAQWCLAGHSYGLLPAFIDGMCDEMPESMTLVDGCENAYWFTSEQAFQSCAKAVRERSALLLSPENRSKYSKQIRVAFPVYLDAIHPKLAGRWTLEPSRQDRLGLLRRNLSAAIQYSDHRVWLYGEHGRWWPEAGDEALWKGKDVYPTWEDQLPGISKLILKLIEEDRKRTVDAHAKTAALASKGSAGKQAQPKTAIAESDPEERQESEIGATVIDVEPLWTSWVEGGVGDVALANGQATITAAADASGLASIEVEPGHRYMIQSQVIQQGRGLTRMTVRWRNNDGSWFEDKKYDVVSYPPPGDPLMARTITAIAKPPPGTTKMVVVCNASQQLTTDDIALFGNLMIGIVDPPESKKEDTTIETAEKVDSLREDAP